MLPFVPADKHKCCELAWTTLFPTNFTNLPGHADSVQVFCLASHGMFYNIIVLVSSKVKARPEKSPSLNWSCLASVCHSSMAVHDNFGLASHIFSGLALPALIWPYVLVKGLRLVNLLKSTSWRCVFTHLCLPVLF